MEQDLSHRLDEQEIKLEHIHASLKRIEFYFKVTMWVTIIFLVLPLVGLLFAIPAFLSTYATMNGLL